MSPLDRLVRAALHAPIRQPDVTLARTGLTGRVRVRVKPKGQSR